MAKSTHVTASQADPATGKKKESVLFDAHPWWKEHGAGSKWKSVAGSVVNEHLQDWLKSPRDQEWAATREKLFSNPDANECVDED